MAQLAGFLPLIWRPGLSSQVLVSAQPEQGIAGIWEVKSSYESTGAHVCIFLDLSS